MGQIALQRDPVNSVRIALILYTLGINWYYQMFSLTDIGNSERLFFGAPKSLQMVTAAMKLKDAYSLEGKL